VKTQTLMDAVNQDHDKERDHLTAELSDVRHKLQLYVFDLDLTLTRLYSDLAIFLLTAIAISYMHTHVSSA